MKLKKKVKRVIVILLVIILVLLGIAIFGDKFSNKGKVKETKIVNKIDNYGYDLKDSKTKTYHKMFDELKKILSKDKVDEEEYAKKISEMFIYDFYSLNDKTAKTDVGGVDFVYSGALANFLLKAEDTYYKYIESNIYGNRNQSLPTVKDIEIKKVSQDIFAYGDKTDEKAYVVETEWDYTDTEFSKYQKSAALVFIHDGDKLCLVELR
jgi:ABC-type Na+ efflux pump permease subunit